AGARAQARDRRRRVTVCGAHPKVAVLTGRGCGRGEIGAALTGWARRFIAAEHLGSDAERLTECSPAEAAARTWAHPNVVLVLAGTWSVIEADRSDTTGEANGAGGTAGPRWAWPPAAGAAAG